MPRGTIWRMRYEEGPEYGCGRWRRRIGWGYWKYYTSEIPPKEKVTVEQAGVYESGIYTVLLGRLRGLADAILPESMFATWEGRYPKGRRRTGERPSCVPGRVHALYFWQRKSFIAKHVKTRRPRSSVWHCGSELIARPHQNGRRHEEWRGLDVDHSFSWPA
jgi:hypothetical protein